MNTNYELKNIDGNEAFNRNLLASMLNSLIKFITKNPTLPKYIVVLFDDDVIHWVNYEDYGVTEIYGRLMKWFITQVDRVIKSQNEYLPQKAKKHHRPYVIWMGASNHKDLADNIQRKKFNDCLASIIKLHQTKLL